MSMNNNKNCELCVKKKARMYCESDEASLCWDCDSKVHSANFLVAKHTRNLLCHSCQNPTPWSASGPKLSLTLSFCNSCLHNPAVSAGFRGERVEESYQMNTTHHMDEYDDDDDDDDDEYDDDDDGNQVVPLSSSSSPLSTFSSCSDGDLSAAGDGGGATAVVSSSPPWKRLRESDSEDEEECSSSLNCHRPFEENKGTSSSICFLRPTKVLRTNELCD